MWLNIWIIDSRSFLIFLDSFNEYFWGLLSFFFFFIFSLFSHFSESFSTLVPLLACAVKIAKHASFVFRRTKNAISRSPCGLLHTVHSASRDLTQKLLLLFRLPVCLPVFSIFKLRLPQFLFYSTAQFFSWSIVNKSNRCNTLPVLRYLFRHFQWYSAQNRSSLFREPFMKSWAWIIPNTIIQYWLNH